MSEYILVILSVFVLPMVFGWIRGKKDVDPNKPYGKIYYSKSPE